MLLVTPSISPSLSLSAILFIHLLSFLNLGALWKGSRSNQRVVCLDWGHLCSLYVDPMLSQTIIIQRCPSGSAQALLTTTHTIQSSMSGNGLLDGVYRLKTSSLSWKPYHLQASCRGLLALFWFERGQNTRCF